MHIIKEQRFLNSSNMPNIQEILANKQQRQSDQRQFKEDSIRIGERINRLQEQQRELFTAIVKGDAVAVQTLIKRNKALLNRRDEENWSPLHIAACYNKGEIANILIKNGASLEVRTKDGDTPLHIAASYGSTDVVEVFKINGAEIDTTNKQGQTPLHLALSYDKIATTTQLLLMNANKEAQDKDGNRALHYAAGHGRVSAAALLLNHGAEKEAENKHGYRAIHFAAGRGNEDVTSILLDHDVSLEARTSDNATALHYAAIGGHPKVITMLVNAGADLGAKVDGKYTPLIVAAYAKRDDAIKALDDCSPKTPSKPLGFVERLFGTKTRPVLSESTSQTSVSSSSILKNTKEEGMDLSGIKKIFATFKKGIYPLTMDTSMTSTKKSSSESDLAETPNDRRQSSHRSAIRNRDVPRSGREI